MISELETTWSIEDSACEIRRCEQSSGNKASMYFLILKRTLS